MKKKLLLLSLGILLAVQNNSLVPIKAISSGSMPTEPHHTLRTPDEPPVEPIDEASTPNSEAQQTTTSPSATRLGPQSFNIPIPELSDDELMLENETPPLETQTFTDPITTSATDSLTPDSEELFFSFVAGTNNLRSIIGNKSIYIYVNANPSPNKPWVIFPISREKYVCYQPDESPRSERSRVISDAKRQRNVFSTNLDYILNLTRNVILDLTPLPGNLQRVI